MIFLRLAPVVAAGLLILTSCNTRRPDRILIPAGFEGWAKIKFEVPNAPPLPVENGHWLIRLDANGHLQTSTMFQGGIAKDEYFYISDGRRAQLRRTESCQGGNIWGVSTGSDPISDHADTEWFFVGSQAKYRHQIDPGERIYIPCLDSGE
ncbi:MAG TPA: hypothetical protein VH596_01965 [Terriglobales bacterium]